MTNIMKHMKKIIFCGTLLISTLGISGCVNKKEDGSKLNIGYFNNITHAQALLMKSEGSLEKSLGEDIQVNWTAFNAGPAEIQALFAESIDIGYIGPVPAVNANTKSDGDVQILTGATKGGAVMVTHPDSGISSVYDLSGKTVSIPQLGNTQHLSLLHLLNEYELEPVSDGGDVNVTAVANADVNNMLERGDIDAALVPEPWGVTLQEQGAELLLDYDKIYMQGQYDVALVVVRKEYMEAYPEIVNAFLEAHEAATMKFAQDEDACLKIINEELLQSTGKALNENILKQAFERILVNTALNKESIMGFAEISEDEDFISDEPEASVLYAQ